MTPFSHDLCPLPIPLVVQALVNTYDMQSTARKQHITFCQWTDEP